MPLPGDRFASVLQSEGLEVCNRVPVQSLCPRTDSEQRLEFLTANPALTASVPRPDEGALAASGHARLHCFRRPDLPGRVLREMCLCLRFRTAPRLPILNPSTPFPYPVPIFRMRDLRFHSVQ
eukprot:557378-Rhodomonas_salina.2